MARSVTEPLLQNSHDGTPFPRLGFRSNERRGLCGSRFRCQPQWRWSRGCEAKKPSLSRRWLLPRDAIAAGLPLAHCSPPLNNSNPLLSSPLLGKRQLHCVRNFASGGFIP
ncbi:hypothetical protein B296_00051354 [Ensete ventricosum]|uniref:Uncharacterized protein n=1 Tax=Ensete ventricosum TaxID=4639 RepID=A0A426XZW7_ENSVE|nr:hypothetical protein B296_00051354 [Ensete ventricosum]